MFRASLYLAAAFLSASSFLFAQPPLSLFDSTGVKIVGRNLAVYEDPTGQLTVSGVDAQFREGAFKPSRSDIINFNVTRSKVWSRLVLINRSSINRWYLECSNPNVNLAEVYVQTSSGYERQVSGFSVLPSARTIGVHALLFGLDLPRDSAVICYVALWDILPLQVHLSIGNAERWTERYERQDFLHGAFFGLLLMLVIYNLFIYIPVRDKVYLFYVIFVIANAWFISFLTGYGIHLPGAASVLQNHPALVPYFLGAASVLFSIVFLDMKRTFRRGYKITVFMFFLLLTVPALDLAGLKHESILWYNSTA